MLTDIEIAQSTPLCPIAEIAEKAGIPAEAAEPYGSNKAKITEDFLRQQEGRPRGKLILVTAVNPTPAGEGKTTTSIGLAQALCRMGEKAIVTLREPSLGPVFGLKGGAAGGGYSQVLPMDEEDRGECEREGIIIHAGWGQTSVMEQDGKCIGIRFRKCLSVKNDEGRFDPRFDDAVTEETACDVVLYCIGQKVEWKELLAGTKVEFNPNGTVKADPVTYQTAEPDIFVGGDAYTGQKFAIDAIAAGKQGAVSLHRWVQHATLTVGRDRRRFIELDKENALIAVDSYDNTPRQQIGYNEALRKTFRDERIAFTEEQVKKETARCLGCGASIVDPNKCIGCGICTTKCAFDAIHLHREHPECSTMYKCEDKMKAIFPYMIKRNFKIKRAARKSK